MAPAEVSSSRKHPRDAANDSNEHRRMRTKLSPPNDPIHPTHTPLQSTSTSTSRSTSLSHRPKHAKVKPIAEAEDSDPSSVLSESSSEPSSDSSSDEDGSSSSEDEGDDDVGSSLPETNDENEDGVVNLRANRGTKPRMKLRKNDLGPDLRPFLKEFLPKLKAANEELEAERRAGTLKKREIDVNEEDENDGGEEGGVSGSEDGVKGQYVEMNLGLGVLEERKSDGSDDSESDDENDDTVQRREKDVMGKLMGQQRQGAVGIQEVGETQENT